MILPSSPSPAFLRPLSSQVVTLKNRALISGTWFRFRIWSPSLTKAFTPPFSPEHKDFETQWLEGGPLANTFRALSLSHVHCEDVGVPQQYINSWHAYSSQQRGLSGSPTTITFSQNKCALFTGRTVVVHYTHTLTRTSFNCDSCEYSIRKRIADL